MKNQARGAALSSNRKEQANQDYKAGVLRDYRRNFWILLVFQFLWGCGLPFATYAVVVPSYMSTLDSPKSLIGLVSSFFTTLCPLQLLFAHWIRKDRKKWIFRLFILGIAPWIIYNIVNIYLGDLLSSTLRLVLFCLCMFLFTGLLTSGNALFFALLTECTPLKKRGANHGYRLCAMSVGVLLTSWFARQVSSNWVAPLNYLVGFSIACAMYMLSLFSLSFMREHNNPQTSGDRLSNHPRLKKLIPQLRLLVRKLVRDPNYRVFIFFMILIFVAMSLAPFIVVYAKEQLGLKASELLVYTITLFMVSAIAGLTLGKLADKAGFRAVGVVLGLLLTVCFCIMAYVAVIGSLSWWLVYVSYVLYAAVFLAAEMVRTNLSVELRPKQDSGMLVAVASSVITPAILLVTFLGGYVIDMTANYAVVFAFGAGLALIGAMGFAVLVREPRGKKMYVVKMIPTS